MLRLTPAGAVAWEADVPSVLPGIEFEINALGLLSDGGAIVTVLQDDFTLPPGAGRRSVLRLDASGALVWRQDDVASRMGALVSGAGDTYVTSDDSSGAMQVLRYDLAGNLLWTQAIPGLSNALVESMTLGPAGQVLVSAYAPGPTPEGRLSLFDASGSLVWERSYTGFPGVSAAEFLADGVLLAAGGLSNGRVDRLDTQGNLVWSRGPSPGMKGITDVALAGNGRIWVGTTGSQPVTLFPITAVELWDDQGLTLSSNDFSSVASPISFPITLTADGRGNGIVGIEPGLTASASPPWASTFKLVSGSPPSDALCDPNAPNSTGQAGELRLLGSGLVASDNLTLRASELPAAETVLFLASMTTAVVPGAGGSQGTLCLGGAIGRYTGFDQVRTSNEQGQASLQLDLPMTPSPTGLVPVMAGQSWTFQAWHRDHNPGPTSNFTSAQRTTFQ